MAGVTYNYSKAEVHLEVRFLQVEGVSQGKIHHRLVSVYGLNVFSQKEESVWCNKFKDGLAALNCDPDKLRSRPRALHTDENCAIVEGLIRKDRRVKSS
jgi:hypothetical protein